MTNIILIINIIRITIIIIGKWLKEILPIYIRGEMENCLKCPSCKSKKSENMFQYGRVCCDKCIDYKRAKKKKNQMKSTDYILRHIVIYVSVYIEILIGRTTFNLSITKYV